MKVYILTSEPYHDNSTIFGVFASLDGAKAKALELVSERGGSPPSWGPAWCPPGESDGNRWGATINIGDWEDFEISVFEVLP